MKGSLINPTDFKLGSIHPRVILLPNLEHLYQFHLLCAGSKIKSFGPSKKFNFEKSGVTYTAIGGMIGAPLAMLTLEHCLAQKIESVITLGTAGWIAAEALPGEMLVCPSTAIDQTGMSAEYKIPSQAPCANLASLPEAGPLVSALGFYNLTQKRLSSYQEAGFQLLDMEVSMIHCYLHSLNIPHQPMIIISDSFSSQSSKGAKWVNLAASSAVKDSLQKAFEIILS